MLRILHLVSAFVCVSLVAPVWAQADAPMDAVALRAGIEKLAKDTKTATWFQKTWQVKGKDEEVSDADCHWMGQDTIRLDIKAGKGKGSVAILNGGKVLGFMKGVFSFAKLSYDPKDDMVIGIRGQGMPASGFMDDITTVLKQWDTVKVTLSATEAVIEYKDAAEGLPVTMWMQLPGLQVTKTEMVEKGKVVQRNQYEKVIYNPGFDTKIFAP